MLEKVEATRFDRAMTKGRTLPLLLAAEFSDGRSVELIGKFSHGGQIGAIGLAREAISAMLAADLGLPVPNPLLVSISDAFIETVPNPEATDLLRQSSRVGFGSSKLPNGYIVWPDGNGVPKRMLAQAAEIFAFDALIQNPDRHPKNPNMQVKGEQVAIYDHELAFIWEGVLFWKPPWEAGGLDNIAQPGRHLFFTAIKGQTLDFSRLIGAWEAISDDRLAQYQAALPAEWNGASDMIGKVLGFVRQLRDNIRPAMTEMQKVLI
ncbi:MAG: hypothetical protein H7172_12400 [Ferruginibacter sp.]|nr:hypothetical protein [Rhodoferax sp.]